MCRKHYCIPCQNRLGDYLGDSWFSDLCACRGFITLCWSLWGAHHNQALADLGNKITVDESGKRYYEDVKRDGLQMCFYCWRGWVKRKRNV